MLAAERPASAKALRRGCAAAALGIALTQACVAAPAFDEESARALAKKSDCFKCHNVESKKEGPAYREVAKKHKGKPDAEAKLFKHLTTAPIVKIDGEEENHQIVKTKKEPEIYNLIRWILSL